MMQLYRVLAILYLTLSTACGLKCFQCVLDPETCTNIQTCPPTLDRCYSSGDGVGVVKGCQSSFACGKLDNCCDGDLCNSAPATGVTVTVPLVCFAIVTLFL